MATALGDTSASKWKIPPPWGKVPRGGLGMLEGDLPEAQLEPAPEELLLQVKLWGVRSGHMGARLPRVPLPQWVLASHPHLCADTFPAQQPAWGPGCWVTGCSPHGLGEEWAGWWKPLGLREVWTLRDERGGQEQAGFEQVYAPPRLSLVFSVQLGPPHLSASVRWTGRAAQGLPGPKPITG